MGRFVLPSDIRRLGVLPARIIPPLSTTGIHPRPVPSLPPMKLHTLPPTAIHSTLRQASVDLDGAVISISSDINLLGQYEPQWLIANRKLLWVFDEDHPTQTLLTVSFEEATEFRTVAVVGSGMLQAKVAGIWLDLLRYSNRQKYYFGRVAKRLDQLREGQTFVLEKEDSHDPRRCATCGLMLEFPGEICPRCINRGAAFRRVLSLMSPYWGAAAAMMVLLIASITISMATPRLTMYLVDNVLNASNGQGHAHAASPAPAVAADTDQTLAPVAKAHQPPPARTTTRQPAPSAPRCRRR